MGLIDSAGLVYFFTFPQYQFEFTQSNMLVDLTTAVLFFLVALLALVRLIAWQGKTRRNWLIFFAVSLIIYYVLLFLKKKTHVLDVSGR